VELISPTLFLIVFSLLALLLFALMAVWAERKVSALLQTLADIIKLIQKESIIPSQAHRWLFILAPLIVFLSVFVGFACLPISKDLIGSNTSIGAFYIFSILTLEVLAIFLASWGSSNKYAMLGGIRSIAQIISYEIPSITIICAVLVLFGTLNLQELCLAQGIFSSNEIYFLGFIPAQQIGGILTWSIFQAPYLLIAFFVFFISALAEANRAPFDIPEAESELVAGFHVEYSGFLFAVFFLAEYAMMFLLSALAVVLFLGGWNSPFPNIGNWAFAEWTNGTYWGIFWLLSKTILLVIAQMWVRWTLPRYRVDQLMKLAWHKLIPLSFLLLFCSIVWRIWVIG
jgi:NADH-quinone oxidoreductase subunit H